MSDVYLEFTYVQTWWLRLLSSFTTLFKINHPMHSRIYFKINNVWMMTELTNTLNKNAIVVGEGLGYYYEFF